jgi:hypothetical protein
VTTEWVIRLPGIFRVSLRYAEPVLVPDDNEDSERNRQARRQQRQKVRINRSSSQFALLKPPTDLSQFALK